MRRGWFSVGVVRHAPITTRIRGVRFWRDTQSGEFAPCVILSTTDGRKVRLSQPDHVRLAAALGADASTWLDREITLRAERVMSPTGGNSMQSLCVYPREAS